MNKWLGLYVAALVGATAFVNIEPGQANTTKVIPTSLSATGKIADRLPTAAAPTDAAAQQGRSVRVVYPSHLAPSK